MDSRIKHYATPRAHRPYLLDHLRRVSSFPLSNPTMFHIDHQWRIHQEAYLLPKA